ncbi:MAG TPA: hypothetical protein VFN31_01035 [Candidatus Saccharimonadales bacterium]|nr:hypothetical protein [Candidatus Saccharimonadales bacterium]
MERQVSGEEYRQMSISSRDIPKTKTIHIPIVWLVIVIVVGVACFLIGESYGKTHTPSLNTATSRSLQGRYGSKRGLRVFGTVSSVSATTITITNQRTGTNSTYNISSATKIRYNGQSVSYNDIQVGDLVIITKSSPGSMDASTINVNPRFGGVQPPAPSTN